MSKIKIIHKYWNDYILLNHDKNTLIRNSNQDKGSFILENNVIKISWDDWDNELFLMHKNQDNIFYLCEEYNFIHDDWENKCYLDLINNIVINNNRKGNFEIDNEQNLIIKWENYSLDIKNNTVIPNIIHFIFGFKEQINEFEFYRYLAIKSAYDVNKPDKIFFYYYYEPYGFWWEKIKPFLILEKVELPDEIYGNKLYHYAHKADVIRLQKLKEYGGIYLDIDTICLNKFTDLLEYEFVMANQMNYEYNEVYGLCNAVILSKPNSNFINKWLESYKTFRSKGRDQFWDEHSVLKPCELSKIYIKDIKILDSKAFFYPLWYDINKILFSNEINIDEYKKIIKTSYCIHLWDTYSSEYLKKLDPKDIFKYNSLYNIFSRKFIKNKISLLMLTYNRLDQTIKCLDSYLKCLNEEYILEFIILDNNSDIDLVNYLKEFQKKNNKIKLIFSNENLGVCGGRSILFEEAIGDIVISLDSDAFLIDKLFFEKIIDLLYNEKYGIIGISGAYLKSWNFGSQEDINDNDENEYIVDHIAGCCQAFRNDLKFFGFKLDQNYGKFWVEDTDLSLQSLSLNKINYRISQKNLIEHHWGGSGKEYKDLFLKNWEYFVEKWKGKIFNF